MGWVRFRTRSAPQWCSSVFGVGTSALIVTIVAVTSAYAAPAAQASAIGHAVVRAHRAALRTSTTRAFTASPTLPTTVSADALPTWQIDGVVWDQITVGNTVYATGEFAYARPPGAAVGASSEVARADLLAYDITTGNLTSFAHSLNGDGRALAASPDGKTLYVGGDFTKVDGLVHNHIAAFSLTSGALLPSWDPDLNGSVRALTATGTGVYAGGDFTTDNDNSAAHVVALNPATGAQLAWAGSANDEVTAMTMSPDQDRVIIAGRFTQIDSSPRYGIGAIDVSNGDASAWDSTFPVRDAGPNAAITDLTADSTTIYGTAYDFGSGGNFEGRFAISPTTGTLEWLDSCHGDSYSLTVVGTVIYSAGHAHDCSDDSSFDQMQNPQRALAETTYRTGTTAHNNDTGNANYHDFGGTPANTVLPWYPDLEAGTYTGQGQAAWTVTSTANYVAYGGEFPTVNGVAQEGLVRFAIRPIAPDKMKPVSKSGLTPTARSVNAGTVLVDWLGTYDPDDETLTYALYRDGGSTPIYTTTAQSAFYAQPELHYLDTGLTPGSSHTYVVHVSDSDNNGFNTYASAAVTVAGSGARSAYETAVTGDGAIDFWPLSESSGSAAVDHIGGNDQDLVSLSSVTRGVPGPSAGGSSTATTFDGTSSGTGQSIGAGQPMSSATVEAWVQTTTAGGQMIDYGLTQGRASAIVTDSLYLDSAGHLEFAVWTPTGYQSVGSTSVVDDGSWHQVAGSVSPSGLSLYVDGKQVATNAAATQIRPFFGFWKLAGDNVAHLPAAPSSPYFTGSLADVAVYPTALTATQVYDHFTGSEASTVQPTSAFTDSCTQLTCTVDGSDSSEPNGSIASWAWDFGDGTSGVGATTSHSYTIDGTYPVTLTVTDGSGATSSVTQNVTVTSSGQPVPVAAAAISCTTLTCTMDGSASSESGGSISQWAWNFGDGTTGSGAQVSHTYSIAGDYPVTLVVTDSSGSTATISRTAVPTAPTSSAATVAEDDFNRTTTGGFGQADLGGTWNSTFASSSLSVTPGAGLMTLSATGTSAGATLSGVSETTTDSSAIFSINKAPTGSGTWAYLAGRSIGSGSQLAQYRARLKFVKGGHVLLAVTVLTGSTDTVLDEVTMPFTYSPGQQVEVRLQVSGTDPTVVGARAWLAGDTEPSAAQVSASDSTAGLQSAGTVGVSSYIPSDVTTVPVTVSVLSLDTEDAALPAAAFTASCSADKCSVDASGSTAGSGSLTYEWSFGDGATSTTTTPTNSHTFSRSGTYRITLTVVDGSGYEDVARQIVTVNAIPTASFTVNCSGLSCSFDASGSQDADGSIVSYAWDFGDGYTSTGVTASHAYSSADNFTATLTVTDNAGASRTTTQAVDFAGANKPPIAAYIVTCQGLNCTFDASTSSDPDGSIVSYIWDFGDGTSGSGEVAEHTYAGPNRVTTSLKVTDNSGASTLAYYIVQTRLEDQPPHAAFIASCVPVHVCTFDGDTSSDPDGSVVEWQWNFGDGATAVGDVVRHTYSTVATRTVTLTVIDDDGVANTTSHVVHPPPSAARLTSAALSASPPTVFPYVDRYRDGTTVQGEAYTSNKSTVLGTGLLRIANSRGAIVVSRSVTTSAPVRLVWRGTNHGKESDGTYTATYVFRDEHNVTVSRSLRIYVEPTRAVHAYLLANRKTVYPSRKNSKARTVTLIASSSTSTGRAISGRGFLVIASSTGHSVARWTVTNSAAHRFTWSGKSSGKVRAGRFRIHYRFAGPQGGSVDQYLYVTVSK